MNTTNLHTLHHHVSPRHPLPQNNSNSLCSCRFHLPSLIIVCCFHLHSSIIVSCFCLPSLIIIIILCCLPLLSFGHHTKHELNNWIKTISLLWVEMLFTLLTKYKVPIGTCELTLFPNIVLS